jgi:FlaA1/EpsC-like NDP-sugar epimerase
MRYAQYFEPTPLLRELNLLECLEASPQTSQSALAKRVGLTPAMVNAYIRRFQSEGLVSTAEVSRGFSYHLTSKGLHRLNYHRVTYRAELVRTVREARLLFQRYFAELANAGIATVVLYGAGETAEVALDALEGQTIVSVLAVVDDDPGKVGSRIRGIPVCGPDAISGLYPDGIVITSVSFAAQIRKRVEELFDSRIQIFSLTDGGG